MPGFKMPRQSTAFANAPIKGKRRPREQDDSHLRWLRTLPCCITAERPTEAAHIRFGSPVYGKRETGGQEKPADKWALPLSLAKHREQHSMNEREFWARYGLDPLRIALALHANTGDDEQAFVILREAWSVRSLLTPIGSLDRPGHESDGD